MEREHTRALEKSHDRVSPFFVPMLIVKYGEQDVLQLNLVQKAFVPVL